jgi:hypothetical protein
MSCTCTIGRNRIPGRLLSDWVMSEIGARAKAPEAARRSAPAAANAENTGGGAADQQSNNGN